MCEAYMKVTLFIDRMDNLILPSGNYYFWTRML